jgi:hypothetical protein
MKNNKNIKYFPDRENQVRQEKIRIHKLEHIRNLIIKNEPEIIHKEDPLIFPSTIMRSLVYLFDHEKYKFLLYALLYSAESVNNHPDFMKMNSAEKLKIILHRKKYEPSYLEEIRTHLNVLPIRKKMLFIIKRERFNITRHTRDLT